MVTVWLRRTGLTFHGSSTATPSAVLALGSFSKR
jgi:hypothetical protein